MTVVTVEGRVVLPDGTAPDHATVDIELVASVTGRSIGWIPTEDLGVGARTHLTCDTTGKWTSGLQPNSLINPANTVYRVTYRTANWSTSFHISVPNTVGLHRVEDILTDAPGSLPTSALTNHLTDTLDAHDASAVSFLPTGTIAATDTQSAVAEVATDAAAELGTHAADTTAVHGIADTAALVTTTSAPELIRDTMGTALVAGADITITVDDVADTITVAAAAALARDAEVAAAYQPLSAKGMANGYASLDVAGTVPDAQIPATIARDAEVAAAYQPVDSDLSAIAALTTTAFGRGLLALADAAALRTTAGTVIGTDVQAYSAVLQATTASFTLADETKLDGIETGATADQTAAEILAALLTVDGVGSGLDADLLDGLSSAAFQPIDSDLTAIAALTTTAFGRSFLDRVDAAAGRTLLGLGTIATQAASAVAVTGGTISGITDLAIADGGTGASTALAARSNLDAERKTTVDIRDFGGVGDNATDNTQAFKDAYDHVVASRVNAITGISTDGLGRVVITIPPGVFRITGTEALMRDLAIARTRGLTFRGAGRDITVIAFRPSAADSCLLRNVDDWLHLTFEDLTFNSDSTTSTFMESYSTGGAQNYVFNRVNWTGTWKRGVNLTGTNTNSEYTWFHCGWYGTIVDGFLYVGATDTSDQFLNYNFVVPQFEVQSGSLAVLYKGGNVSVWGGSLIHINPTSTSRMFELRGTSHGYGVCRFLMAGSRMEHRTVFSQLVYSEWPDGVLTFVNIDTSSQTNVASMATAILAEFAFGNTSGPTVEWIGCRLSGKHSYGVQNSGWLGAARVHYRSCVMTNHANPHDFITSSVTGGSNLGGLPAVAFEACRGTDATKTTGWGTTVNWERNLRSVPRRRSISVKSAAGTSPIASGPQTVYLPLNAVITRVYAVKPAGGASTSSTWEYNLADGNAVTVASLTAATTVWNTAWTRSSGELFHLCSSENARTLTLTPLNITEGSASLSYVIEYTA